MQKFGYHDLCATVFMPTTCTGEYDPDEGFHAYCGTSSTTFRKTVNEATEQESANPSGTTGKKCLYRRVPPTPGDCFLDILTCGIEDAGLWAKLGLEAPIKDEDTGQICGFEEPVLEENDCVSCGKDSATCRHKFAVMTVHNKWCGDDQRATDAPYVARLYPSLLIEAVEESETFGQGFTQFRTITGQLQRNPLFVDPFGIDPRQGILSKYRVKNMQCPDGTLIDQVMSSACNCGTCEGDLTIQESTPFGGFEPVPAAA